MIEQDRQTDRIPAGRRASHLTGDGAVHGASRSDLEGAESHCTSQFSLRLSRYRHQPTVTFYQRNLLPKTGKKTGLKTKFEKNVFSKIQVCNFQAPDLGSDHTKGQNELPRVSAIKKPYTPMSLDQLVIQLISEKTHPSIA